MKRTTSVYVYFFSDVTGDLPTYREVVLGPFDYAYVSVSSGKLEAVGQFVGEEDSEPFARFSRGRWVLPAGRGTFEEMRFTTRQPSKQSKVYGSWDMNPRARRGR